MRSTKNTIFSHSTVSKGQFSPQFFLESYVYNIRIVLPETSTLYQHDIGYLLQPNVFKKRTFWPITYGGGYLLE